MVSMVLIHLSGKIFSKFDQSNLLSKSGQSNLLLVWTIKPPKVWPIKSPLKVRSIKSSHILTNQIISKPQQSNILSDKLKSSLCLTNQKISKPDQSHLFLFWPIKFSHSLTNQPSQSLTNPKQKCGLKLQFV